MSATFNFTFDDIPNLERKVAIVTGGNSGLGEVIARELARKGCKVYIASRSHSRAEAAIARIREDIGTDENLAFLELDLETMKGAVMAAKFFMKLETRLDILVANAGLGGIKSELTPEGYERNFGVKHLGHFAFVSTLLPLIQQTADGNVDSDVRIVIMSSKSYENSHPIDFDNVRTTYHSWFAFLTLREMLQRYSRSKLANLYFMRELADLVKDRKNIYVNACHPGLVYTHIFDLSTSPLPWYMQLVGQLEAKLLGINVNDGVKTALFLAADRRVVDKNIKGILMYPGPTDGFVYFSNIYIRTINKLGLDDEARKQLWRFSEAALEKA
ncbi:hypothetical protein POJ06DRAFT_256635 [Lipomyces tetrasporus]|uniref:NAD(P)-binding protein n=1 Tax=Lipomyces tetrasporus TaxID=54092 RepID=A0AAD7QQ40_9ASCO|nr:uncharacterized protein POJ06DRAFT_256635 [Lipomyces tetrasporus]KAJ8099314.1 hypothetical protein POJ06DRAFT_256635 [Lipomyces tetrasporus]